MKEQFVPYIRELQNIICSELEVIDGASKFSEDVWKRPEGGGGKSRIIENGNVFEKGGVNISEVHGILPESIQESLQVKSSNFFACGLSLVLHPKNPFVPTVHANWRYFELYDEDGAIKDQWFGGGQDLTPYYLFEEDVQHFHSICKQQCDKFSVDYYPTFKKQCDTYFYNSHRNEARGVGGLFYDYLRSNDAMSMKELFNFITSNGDSFLHSYLPIVEKRKDIFFNKNHRAWQEIRRGRYVEFNLIHDKGTLFGLKTNGRIESVLMSLPPMVQWKYNHTPEEGSEEEKLLNALQHPKDWI